MRKRFCLFAAILLTILLLGTAAHAETPLRDWLTQHYAADGWTVLTESSWASNGAAILRREHAARLLLLTLEDGEWRVTGVNEQYDWLYPYSRYSLHMDTEDLLIITRIDSGIDDLPVYQRYYRLTDGRWLLESEYCCEDVQYVGPDSISCYTEHTAAIVGSNIVRQSAVTDGEGNPLLTRNLAPLPNVLTDDERDLRLEINGHPLATAYGYAVDESGDVDQAIMKRLFDSLAPAGYSFEKGVMAQADGMFFLAASEKDGQKRLVCIGYRADADQWQTVVSKALPAGCGIGLENFTDAVRIGDTAYGLRYDGQGGWRVQYLIGQDYTELPAWGASSGGSIWNGSYTFGDAPWKQDLSELDWRSLPHSYSEAVGMLDSSRWATPRSDNPADRLHLRAKPDKNSASLGKYLNGTPVHVVDMNGTWCKVRVGSQVGYMMTKYLAFGSAAAHVKSALTSMLARHAATKVIWDDGSQELLTPYEVNSLGVVGVYGDDWTLVWDMASDRFGRIPSDQLWPGNG